MKKGYINGSDLLLLINGKAIGHCSSHSLEFTSETKDRQVKPVATADMSSGLWKEKGVTGLSISISADGIGFYDEAEFGRAELLAAWNAGEAVTVKACERGKETKPYLEGSFIITKVSESSPAQDDVTYNLSLENNGQPTTFAPSEITNGAAE